MIASAFGRGEHGIPATLARTVLPSQVLISLHEDGSPMNAPRWFYPIIAASAFAVAIAALLAAQNGRYVEMRSLAVEREGNLPILDTRTGRVCEFVPGGITSCANSQRAVIRVDSTAVDNRFSGGR